MYIQITSGVNFPKMKAPLTLELAQYLWARRRKEGLSPSKTTKEKDNLLCKEREEAAKRLWHQREYPISTKQKSMYVQPQTDRSRALAPSKRFL